MIPSIDNYPMTPVRRGAAVKLLRMAKIQCSANAAICVVQESDGSLTITSYPDFFGQTRDVPWSPDEISELATRIWLDPHMTHEQPFVRAMTLGTAGASRPVAFVAATSIDDESRSLRGVVFVVRTSDVDYSIEDLTALQIVRRRFSDHLRAVQDLADAHYFDLGPSPYPSDDDSQPEPPPMPPSVPPIDSQIPDAEATPDIDSDDTALGLPTIGPLLEHLTELFDRSDPPNIMVALVDLDGEPSEMTSRLILAGRRLHKSIRRDDFVARIGRTIFAIAIELPDDVDLDDAVVISERLAATAEPGVGVVGDDRIAHASVALSSSMPMIEDDQRSSSEIATALVKQAWTRLQTP